MECFERTVQFSDVQFMTAKEKALVLKAWVAFVKSAFSWEKFTKQLYNHLIHHCSFIAHYDRYGFWSYYYADPSQTTKFIEQFDRAKGNRSAEYAYDFWATACDYEDIKKAMISAIEPHKDQLYRAVREKQIETLQKSIAMANAELVRLQAT